MKTILILIVGRDLNHLNLRNINKNIIMPLEGIYNIDFCSVTNDKIKNQFKYNFICKKGQLDKVCYAIDKIDVDNYEWIIKTRPDILFLEKIDGNFFNRLSEDKVNSRCRSYHGPKIKIKNGFSLRQSNIRKRDSILCDEEKFIMPDDQFYIFHQKIAKRTFEILTLESLKIYVDTIKIEKPKWVHSWISFAIVKNYENFIMN